MRNKLGAQLIWMFFSFKGVLSRKIFFVYAIALQLILIILVFVLVFTVPSYGYVFLALRLLFMWPVYALRAKRLHDAGLSGWWQLPFIFIDWFTPIIGIVVIGCWPPQKEENKYLVNE